MAVTGYCSECGSSEHLWAWYSQPERQTIAVEINDDGAVVYDYTGITESGEAPGPDEQFFCGNCIRLTDTIEEMLGFDPPAPALDAKAALDEIHSLLSGVEWSADTIEDVASVLTRAGYVIEEPA